MADGRLSFGVALLAVALLVPTAAPRPAASTYPRSMAVLGDSLSRGYGAGGPGEHPEHAWATGDGAGDGVLSHLERLRLVQPAIASRAYDDAVSGASAADLRRQARRAVAQHAQYVAILMGTNDACAPTRDGMTSARSFRASLLAAFAVLDGLPSGSRVFVASVPDVTRLWDVLHRSASARRSWSVLPGCLNVLGPAATERGRALVRARIAAFNASIAELCARRASCRTDGGAWTAYRFPARDVSSFDSFHPSLSGQAALAARTWAFSWWPGAR